MTNQSKIEAAKNDNFCHIEFDMITQLEKMAVQSIPIDSIWLCYVGMHLPSCQRCCYFSCIYAVAEIITVQTSN